MTYELDLKCTLAANIVRESIDVTNLGPQRRFVVPSKGPFFIASGSGFTISYQSSPTSTVKLIEGVDYHFTVPFLSATKATGRLAYAAIRLRDKFSHGTVSVVYHTIGGVYTEYKNAVTAAIAGCDLISTLTFDDIAFDSPRVPQLIPDPDEMQLKTYKDFNTRLGFIPNAITSATVNNAVMKAPPATTNPLYTSRDKVTFHLTDNTNPHRLGLDDFGLSLATDADAAALKGSTGLITLGQLATVIAAIIAKNPDTVIPAPVPDPVITPTPVVIPTVPNVDDPIITLVKAQYTSSTKDKVDIDLKSTNPAVGLMSGDSVVKVEWSCLPTGTKVPVTIDNSAIAYTKSLTTVDTPVTGWDVSVKYTTLKGATATGTLKVVLTDIQDADSTSTTPWVEFSEILPPPFEDSFRATPFVDGFGTTNSVVTTDGYSKCFRILSDGLPITGDSIAELCVGANISSLDSIYTRTGVEVELTTATGKTFVIPENSMVYSAAAGSSYSGVQSSLTAMGITNNIPYSTVLTALGLASTGINMKEIEESCTVIIRLNAAVVTLVPPTPIVSDVTAANQTTAFTLNVQIPAASTTNASMPTGVTGTVNGYKTIDGVTTAITLSHSTITAAEVTSGFSFNENLPRFSGTSLIYYTFEVTYTLNAKTYSGVKSESFCFPATPAATPSATPTAAETVGVPSTFTGSIKVTLPSGTKMYYDIPPDTLEDAQAYILAHPGSTVVTTPA